MSTRKVVPSRSRKADRPAEVKITAAKGRPMLTWVGKRPLTRVTAFPAQHVETFDPSGDAAQRTGPEWDDWPAAYPHGGLLFHGDNKEVLAHLLANGFRGKVDLIYIDPPFDSGADYVRRVSLRGAKGTAKLDGDGYTLGEQIQYTDIWANDNYLQFMYERLLLHKEFLGEHGTIFLHCDAARGHQLRCLMDEVFGADMFRNEIIWHYENKLGTGGETFDSRHDSLLVYTKSKSWTHNPVMLAVKEMKKQPVTQKVEGKRVWLRDEEGRRLYQLSRSQRPEGDVWTIPIINPVGSERTGFPTQKPVELLLRIIGAASNSGDLVLDSFIGSGTSAIAAQQLGRRWIGCDINKGAIQTTSKRLQDVITAQLEDGQETLIEDEAPAPAQLSFTTWRVNDYDLQIQHNEVVNLACEHIGVQRSRTDRYFDGALGKSLVKIAPFTHPLSPADLDELRQELEARPDEDRNVVVVCLGIELAAQAWIEDWNRLRRGRNAVNRIEVIELRTDERYGAFLAHDPASAKVKIERKGGKIHVRIDDFISPTIVKRLAEHTGVVHPKIDDWRAMVDCVMIDTSYGGEVFDIALSDVPERKTDLVRGEYQLPAPKRRTTVAVKITDMLGEEVLHTGRI